MFVKCSRSLIRLFAMLGAALAGWGAVFAVDRLEGPVPGVVERVIDGDTIVVRAQIWLDQELSVHVRIAAIDAPEIRRSGCGEERAHAEAARDRVEALTAAPGGEVRLANIRYGKYARRVVADVILADGRDLATVLIADELAVPEREEGAWCVLAEG